MSAIMLRIMECETFAVFSLYFHQLTIVQKYRKKSGFFYYYVSFGSIQRQIND